MLYQMLNISFDGQVQKNDVENEYFKNYSY